MTPWILKLLTGLFLLIVPATGFAQQPPHCELIPLPGRRVSLQIDGVEQTQWHAGLQDPHPFLFPVRGPSGALLTRLGHPGAPDHEHHRSIWLGYQNIDEQDFWTDSAGTRIRQTHWYDYRSGTDEAILAVRLGWIDADAKERLDQDAIIALRPRDAGEYELEFHFTLRPPDGRSSVTLGQTSLGLLAVRVSESISEHFGRGQLTGSSGRTGEADLFGQPAAWMDYSGPVAVGRGSGRRMVTEGITFHDHPDNPRYPARWHVRSDGWMGVSFGRPGPWVIRSGDPLILRYLLHIHRGPVDAVEADRVHRTFAARAGFTILPPGKSGPHRRYRVQRATDAAAD